MKLHVIFADNPINSHDQFISEVLMSQKDLKTCGSGHKECGFILPAKAME